MYRVKLYYNTGFNTVNVPDKPSLLDQFTSEEFPALDILQHLFLSNVKIKARWDEVIEADYLMLYNDSDSRKVAYYSIQSISMRAVDTAMLNITIDSWLTAGGLDNVTPTDGMTVRHHVALEDDLFGAYCEDDDMLVPSEPLEFYTAEGGKEILSGTIGPNWGPYYYMYNFREAKPGRQQGSMYLVASTVNLSNMDTVELNSQVEDNYASFVVPKPIHAEYAVEIGVPSQMSVCSIPGLKLVPQGDTGGHNSGITFRWFTDASCQYYGKNWTSVKESMSNLRGIGLENCIISSYSVPYEWLGDGMFAPSDQHIALINSDGACKYLCGTTKVLSVNGAGNKYLYDTTIKNKRVLYGKYNAYKIIALGTGASNEYLPEDLIPNPEDVSSTAGDANTQPYIVGMSDPRPEGCPMYNMVALRNKHLPVLEGTIVAEMDMKANTYNPYDGAINGAPWIKEPIIFEGKSGGAIEAVQYQHQQLVNDTIAMMQPFDMSVDALTAGRSAAKLANPLTYLNPFEWSEIGDSIKSYVQATDKPFLTQGYYEKLTGQSVGNMLNTSFDANTEAAIMGSSVASTAYKRQLAKEQETLQYTLSTSIAAPTIAFPRVQNLQDFNSNGLFVGRYRPTENDRKKFDEVLNRFGYRITEVFNKNHMQNRSKFNYVQVAGAHFVAGTKVQIPKTIYEDISNMFNVGIRIWHTRPGNYDNNV